MKRVIAVEEFSGPRRDEIDGELAYYLDGGATRPWNGTLPAGTIRLRVRVALVENPRGIPGRCRLIVGPYVIEGPVNGSWPT